MLIILSGLCFIWTTLKCPGLILLALIFHYGSKPLGISQIATY